MAAIFSAILGLCAGLPKLLALVEQAATFITDWCDQYHKDELAKEMKKATDEAKKTGDTSKIDDLFNSPK